MLHKKEAPTFHCCKMMAFCDDDEEEEETTFNGPAVVPVLASVSGAKKSKTRAGGGGLKTTTKKTTTMKSFFLWGTGNEILVRCESVPVDDTKEGKNTKEGGGEEGEDGEREEEGEEEEDIFETKAVSWSHASAKNKEAIARCEPLVKDVVQKIRLGTTNSFGTNDASGGSDFRLEAAREFSSKAIEIFQQIEKELEE